MKDEGEKEINRDNLLKKVVPILLVLTAFLLISEHLQKQEVRNINEMDEDKDFDVIDTYDQLKFYEQIESGYGVEQLRKADQYGLIQTFENKTIPVMGSKRTVQIHEVWSNNQDIYLLYSVNLLLPDKSPKDVPYLEVDQLTLHNPKEPPIAVNAEFYSTNGVKQRENDQEPGHVESNAYIEFRNNEGKLLELLGIAGHLNRNESSLDIALETSDFIDSNGLSIRFCHFSKPVEFISEKFTITIPKQREK